MKPPLTFLAETETKRLRDATRNGELLGVSKSEIGAVCSGLRKAALMRVSAPVYVFPNRRFICEGRKKVEPDRGKKRLQTEPNCEEPTEEAAPLRFEVARTRLLLSNSPWDSGKEGLP